MVTEKYIKNLKKKSQSVSQAPVNVQFSKILRVGRTSSSHFLQVGGTPLPSGFIWWARLHLSCRGVVTFVFQWKNPDPISTFVLNPYGLVASLLFITMGCLYVSAIQNSSILCWEYSVFNYTELRLPFLFIYCVSYFWVQCGRGNFWYIFKLPSCPIHPF